MAFSASFKDGFSPLQNRQFSLYFTGQGVSMLGTWMQVTAQSWVVWQLSRSMSALGVVAMLGSLPLLAFGPLAGVAADRIDRRKLLIATQIVAMLLAVALAVLTQTGVIRLWHVYVLATLLGAVAAFDFPTQQAFVGDLVGMSEIRKATALNGILVQLGRMLGPAFAGWVISKAGVAEAFWLNGVSFLAVIASLYVIRARGGERKSGASKASGGFGECLKFIAANPRVLDNILFGVLISFFVLSNLNIYPAFATVILHGDSQTLGLLLGASGAGALVGSIFTTSLTQATRRVGRLLIGCIVWAGAVIFVNSFSTRAATATACIFISSMSIPFIFVTTNGLMQVLAPPEMRARLLSAYLMASFGTQPLASLLVGYIGDAFGSAQALRFNGVMLLAGGVAMALRRGLLNWEATPTPIGAPRPGRTADLQPETAGGVG
jgi:MFS family permease